MGQEASSSESLLEQARQTASVTYEAAKEKAAPIIEQAQPSIKAVKEKIGPVVSSAKEIAETAYDTAQEKVHQYAEQNPESQIV